MARPRKTNRRERVSFGQMRSNLKVDDATLSKLEKQGKVPRWVNDENGGMRLKELYDRGYEFVTATGAEVVGDPDGGYMPPAPGTHISKHVGTDKQGKPMAAYLMAIDKDYYDEDRAQKEEINAKVDEAIKGGNAPGPEQSSSNNSQGRTYVKDIQYKP